MMRWERKGQQISQYKIKLNIFIYSLQRLLEHGSGSGSGYGSPLGGSRPFLTSVRFFSSSRSDFSILRCTCSVLVLVSYSSLNYLSSLSYRNRVLWFSVVAVVSTTRGRDHSSIDPFPISFPLLNSNLPLFFASVFSFTPFVSFATASLFVPLYLSLLFYTIRSLLYFTPATSSKRHDHHHHHLTVLRLSCGCRDL